MIQELVKCEKCEGEARLVKVLSTEEKRPRRQRETERWIYLQDALILIYQCQKCANVFNKIMRK